MATNRLQANTSIKIYRMMSPPFLACTASPNIFLNPANTISTDVLRPYPISLFHSSYRPT
ncbi:hypothetical protein CENSYa_1189 [Cenarchaeum symbiosum A]|uniref:Uncharacterized protein n=1 Tax=Cenarchaeum symbiosum (strain A) TaxID=414004 RepID=A0RWU6_CENSY|nr:hypothetical protein CENSYa_1189 [Cenarchaeum symbiosum A]